MVPRIHHRNHLFKVYTVEIERVRKLLLFQSCRSNTHHAGLPRNSSSLKFRPQPIIDYLCVTNWVTDVPNSRGTNETGFVTVNYTSITHGTALRMSNKISCRLRRINALQVRGHQTVFNRFSDRVPTTELYTVCIQSAPHGEGHTRVYTHSRYNW